MVGIAQLVEHLVVVQGAAGSSPVTHPNEKKTEDFSSVFFFFQLFSAFENKLANPCCINLTTHGLHNCADYRTSCLDLALADLF